MVMVINDHSLCGWELPSIAIHMQNASVACFPGAYNFYLPFRLNGTELLLLFKTCLDPLGSVGFSRSRTVHSERCDKC